MSWFTPALPGLARQCHIGASGHSTLGAIQVGVCGIGTSPSSEFKAARGTGGRTRGPGTKWTPDYDKIYMEKNEGTTG